MAYFPQKVALIYFCTILLLCHFLLTISEAGVVSDKQAVIDDDICLTKECIVTASRLIESMDTTVDPCTDFYQYACGGWIREHNIPAGSPFYSNFDVVSDRVNKALLDALKSDTKNANNAENQKTAIEKAKNMFAACMDGEQKVKRGIAPALDFLAKNNIPWPIVKRNEPFNEAQYNVAEAAANSALLGMDHIIQLFIEQDTVNADKHRIWLHQMRTDPDSADMPVQKPPPLQYILQQQRTANYRGSEGGPSASSAADNEKTKINSMLKWLKPFYVELYKKPVDKQTQAKMRTEITDLNKFADALHRCTSHVDFSGAPMQIYNKISIKNLMLRAPGFDWLTFLKTTFAGVKIPIDENEEIVITTPKYMVKLAKLLAQTPKRVIANYVAFEILTTYLLANVDTTKLSEEEQPSSDPTTLPTAPKTLPLSLHHIVSDATAAASAPGAEAPPPPSPQSSAMCIAMVTAFFPMAVGRLYIDKYVDQSSKPVVNEMLNEIKNAFNQRIAETEWLTPNERKLSLLKTAAMEKFVGYPSSLLDDTWLNSLYSSYIGKPDDWFENYIHNSRMKCQEKLGKLREPVDRTVFQESPTTVNGFYIQPKNAILIGSAMFQPPFFSTKQPMAINYGAAGRIIAHELTHGFDVQGRLYDHRGNLNHWWSSKTAELYNTKAQCIVDQFNAYTIDGTEVKVDGQKTLGENIADLGGYRQSYRAYRNWAAKAENTKIERQRLPTFEKFTNEQMYFLGGAAARCSHDSAEGLLYLNRIDNHSPVKYRINGPFSNMDEFSQAFKCPAGSAMNRANKCRIW